MKNLKTLTLVFLTTLLLTGCFEDNDDNTISANEISDFVWKGMNVFYLYKDNIPVLANDRFSSNEEYASYLNDYATPEDLFESLIFTSDLLIASMISFSLIPAASGVFSTSAKTDVKKQIFETCFSVC